MKRHRKYFRYKSPTYFIKFFSFQS